MTLFKYFIKQVQFVLQTFCRVLNFVNNIWFICWTNLKFSFVDRLDSEAVKSKFICCIDACKLIHIRRAPSRNDS